MRTLVETHSQVDLGRTDAHRVIMEHSLPSTDSAIQTNAWWSSTGKGLSSVLLYGPGHAKTCLMPYANNKGSGQPAHPRSLISTFVVRCLDRTVTSCILAQSKVSRFQLASEHAGLNHTWSQTPTFGVLGRMWIWLSPVTRKPVFGVCVQVRLLPVCSATETS